MSIAKAASVAARVAYATRSGTTVMATPKQIAHWNSLKTAGGRSTSQSRRAAPATPAVMAAPAIGTNVLNTIASSTVKLAKRKGIIGETAKFAVHTAEAVGSAARMTRALAVSQSTRQRVAASIAKNPGTFALETGKIIGIGAIKPIKAASIVYGVREFQAEKARINKDKDAQPAKPGRTATADAIRTGIKGLGYAALFHPRLLTKNNILLAAYLTGVPNSGAAGRTLARAEPEARKRLPASVVKRLYPEKH